jgi:hypothetical protein
MFMGPDNMGAWGIPADKNILIGAAPYVQAVFPAWAPPSQDVGGCCSQQTLNYFDQYSGKPMFTITFSAATADSFLYPFFGNTGSDKGTQELKGQFVEAALNNLLTMQTNLGNYLWIGAVGWGLLDFWTDGGGSTSRTNWGLVSLNDNPYDGKSDCAVTRTDPLGFATTAEATIPVWQASHAYAVDSTNGIYPTIQPTTGTLYLFRQLSGSGTSGGSEPTWSCAVPGTTTIADGSVTWTCLGTKASASCFGDSVDYVKQANSLWWAITPGTTGGSVSGGKTTSGGKAVRQ